MSSHDTANEAPVVSVLMLTFNRPQFISRAIESIRAQSLTNWELIVVHDGPNEEIRQILLGWEQRDRRIRYFHRPRGGNIAEANNYGLRLARGRFVAILDDDDYWLEASKLERQMAFLESHPEYAGCGGGAVCIDERGRETMRYLKPQTHEQIVAVALLANPLLHSSSMYRLEAAAAVGFYDESLAGFQDWDLWLKLVQVGKLANFPEFLYAYQMWDGGGSFAAQRRNTESALRIVKRHGGRFRGKWKALAMAWAYYLYARLPLGVRKATFHSLSRLKKMAFSGGVRSQRAE
ncbi:MAG: glycosyltransferase [Acidobacteria bacterium]|nr:glycosyltransferase [Acidobacteriota bacterium]